MESEHKQDPQAQVDYEVGTYQIPTELIPFDQRGQSSEVASSTEQDLYDTEPTPEEVQLAVRRERAVRNMLEEAADDPQLIEKANKYSHETDRKVGKRAVEIALLQEAALDVAARKEHASLASSGTDADSTGPRESAQQMPVPRRKT